MNSLPTCVAGNMAQGLIEVERKFTPGPDTEGRLQELGGTLEHRVTFQDTYYDTSELSLMRSDHWLRQREGSGWELKCPGVAGISGSHNEYVELTSESAIVAQLFELLGTQEPGTAGVAAVLGSLKLEEVASFVTTRSSWMLALSGASEEELKLRVDLDSTDFGYAVGEVEVMVREKAQVAAALEKIFSFSTMLGEGDRLFDATSTFHLTSLETTPPPPPPPLSQRVVGSRNHFYKGTCLWRLSQRSSLFSRL